MNLSPIVTIFTFFVSIFASSHVMALVLPSDLEIFQSCYSTAPTGLCVNADFNNDGLINTNDFSLFRNAARGDFDGDYTIDLRTDSNNQDLNFLSMCIEQNTQPNCAPADLNADGLINNLDLDEFNGFTIFDLNNDNIVNFNANTSPAFQYVHDINLIEGENKKVYIWAADTSLDVVTYTLISAPEKAIVTPVIMGDFNNDDIVDGQDVDLINNAIVESDYEQQFDLNNDNLVDQLDIDILQFLVGKVKQALLFSWSPGDRDSGFYEIKISATDETGLTSQANISLTVYDVDAYSNYYSYDDVLLVVNDQSPASQTIGEYFADNRGIPASRIAHISTLESETVSRQTFEQEIRAPLESFIFSNQLESSINYIVTTKGVPLRISGSGNGANYASVDSELSLILGPYADQIGAVNAVQNPYYDIDYPFSREMFGIFLVTRLTAYTVNDAISLIDRSEQPEQSGIFVLDVDPTKDTTVGFEFGNLWLRNAASVLEEAGQTVLLDETNSFVTNQSPVLGYASWGSNDANSIDNAKPNFDWLPGSIAETFVSTSARSFSLPPVYGQSLVADLIAEGVTGAKGYVYEPTLSAMAKPNILFDRYTKGYCLADSYFSASNSLGWQDVVIGDPKMAINKNMLKSKNNHNQMATPIISSGSGSTDPLNFSLFLLLISIRQFHMMKNLLVMKKESLR